MTNQEFLKSMSSNDSLLDHSPDACGMCGHLFIMAETARDLLKIEGSTISDWSDETKRRWENSKYFKLWQEEKAAGRDPNVAFAERGWEP